MDKKTVLVFSLILSLFGVNSANCFASTNYNYSPNTIENNSKLQGYAVFVPAGISCNALLSSEINSNSAVIGQTINAVLTEDFIYNDTIIASAGSVIAGTIVSNKKAGYGNRNAQTQIRFTNIRTPYNNVIPISATIMTNDLTGILKGGTAKDSLKDYAKNTAIGAGSGAVLGTAMGALSSGSVGKGAIYGTALGAGMGLIKGASEKGEDVLIPSNSQINIYFDQPITLNAQ